MRYSCLLAKSSDVPPLCVCFKNDLHISWTDWMWFMAKQFSWPLFNRSKAVFLFDRVSITSQLGFLEEKENSFHSSGYQEQPNCETRWPNPFGQSVLERALLFQPPTWVSRGKIIFSNAESLDEIKQCCSLNEEMIAYLAACILSSFSALPVIAGEVLLSFFQ